MLATFTVSSLASGGAGSLRAAIQAANASPGADTIDFVVSGTIRLAKALPIVADTLTIDGSSAPGFAGSPVVTVDFQGRQGFLLARGSDGSILRSLSLVKAGGAGVTLVGSHNRVEGNYIGLLADGVTAAGNRGDGVRIAPGSRGNIIGRVSPVQSVDYYDASSVGPPVSGWQGIRNADASGQFLMAGTSDSNGLLYIGPISGTGGTPYFVNVPGASSTSVYGPDNLGNGSLRLVGSYRVSGDDIVRGFLFEGTTADLANPANYRTIAYPNQTYTYVHSTMGGLAVGNADISVEGTPDVTGHAFLYDIARDRILPDIVYPGSSSTTAYGIWSNGGTGYTICGGYTYLNDLGQTVSHAYLVDYDSATGSYSHWTSFDDPDGKLGHNIVTHFQGISGYQKGVYSLSADSTELGKGNLVQGSWVTVRRNADGSFGPSVWVDLNYPGTDPNTVLTSNDSVAGDAVVGIVISTSGTFSYQANLNVGFQLSNVISGNAGNGIGIYGAHENQVVQNFIGTNASGSGKLGNGKSGVLITQGATANMIGGQATGGNDPTGGVFVRPPQGNLISGNRASGVRITGGATRNVLSGNFIGTTASGNAALGNRLDGVAIDRADGNALIGCTFQQDPFVFYNVISGNGGNGLRITNANNTTVHANFMGVGADNATVVANGGNGLLVSGSSMNTQVGGVIPLGNVISGNNRNGIEVKDRASGFVSFNTFAGVVAFGGAAPNRGSGILVTSTGGNNLIRTCIVSGNLGNGIEIGGNATGVQVTDTAVGTNTAIQDAIPNGGHGILISGNAHGNAIGGFQPSVEPEVTVSANQGYGIAFVGKAHDNVVFHTFIGTKAQGTGNLGNALGGILLDAGTRANTIGAQDTRQRNKINFSGGNGVTIRCSKRAWIEGTEIVSNQGYGIYARGECDGSAIRGNVIAANAQGNVDLSKARGVTYIP